MRSALIQVVCSHMKAFSNTRLPDKKVFVRLYKGGRLKQDEWVETMTTKELKELLQRGYIFKW